MAPGASITYTVTAGILPSATGALVNTAQVAAPRVWSIRIPATNTATDRTRLTPQVDLRITKTDNRDSAVPGLTQLSYTIVVTNAGPSAVSGAWVTDQLPDALQNVAYTSVTNGYVTGNTASGTGNIDDLLSMAPGASITYTVTAGILPSATGALVNTAQVAAPQGVVDTNSGKQHGHGSHAAHAAGRSADHQDRQPGFGRAGSHTAHLHDRRDQRRTERLRAERWSPMTFRTSSPTSATRARFAVRRQAIQLQAKAISLTLWAWLQAPRSLIWSSPTCGGRGRGAGQHGSGAFS